MKKHLIYKKSILHFNNNDLSSICKKYKTPFYLYDEKIIQENYTNFYNTALENEIPKPLICFALKSNPNAYLLKFLAKLGAGADIVSGGELELALNCGIDPQKIVFSGVGKTDEEIVSALKASKDGIYSFNVESEDELEAINYFAKKLNKTARVAFRLNPQVHAKTHKYISTGYKTHKFGVISEEILKMYKKKKLWTNTNLVGLSIHIGSQLTCMKATKKAIGEMFSLAKKLNTSLDFLDVGGGLGIPYHSDEKVTSIADYMKDVSSSLMRFGLKGLPGGENLRIVFEPGRVLVGDAGLLVTKVLRTKKSGDTHFAIVDGGMNDLARPSLYSAHHDVLCVKKKASKKSKVDVVGPICESADSFASGLEIPAPKKEEFIIIADAGAYGMSMASNYNIRNKPKEVVLTKNKKVKVI